MFGKTIISLESELIHDISQRFKELRGDTPIELFSTQRANVYRIENGENTDSGNFVTASILDDYSKFFGVENEFLVFGNDTDLELLLGRIFDSIIFAIGSDDIGYSVETTSPLVEFLSIFADFNRWYKIRRFAETDIPEIDLSSMFQIFWALIKKKVIRSFKEQVIQKMFNKPNSQFKFNQLNKEFEHWYRKDFSKIIVPDALSKLKNDSIFKMGFMVSSLIDEFLVTDIPESYTEDVPLEEFYLPTKNYYFESLGESSMEEREKIASEISQLFLMSTSLNSRKEILDFEKAKFFEGITSVEDLSTPLIDRTRKVSAIGFLDSVLKTPEVFDMVHRLNDNHRKIPGILTINSQASKLFQINVNDVVLTQINDLVRFQNIYINLIKWEELEIFL